ncbi:hypothetical protein FO519_007388 [Halicephalobus sp. NKZ332]|nr:hypothetical protein FO519_007388 [Halicephalobus sp. NKZ332]
MSTFSDFSGFLVFFLRIPESDFSKNKSFEKAVCASSRIDSSYFHVGILSEKNSLIHATVSQGVIEQSLPEALEGLHPDAIEFCEVDVEKSKRVLAVDFASKSIGSEYNDVFSPENINSKGKKSFYCCQLVSQAYGRDLFNDHRLNFLDGQGNFIDYWVYYFRERNYNIPQGALGTHPSILRFSPIVKFRGRQDFTMKSFLIPSNLTEALHFIGGKRLKLSKENPVFEVVEPRSGKILTTVEEATRSDVQFAVEASRKAQEQWISLPKDERSGILRKVAQLIRENFAEISKWETIDNGKSIYESKLDILSCADTFDHFAGIDLNGEHIPLSDSDSRFAYTRREPLGVVGAIGAWNYPMQTATWKIAPAIACGNGIVYKPSPLAPITTVILAQILQLAGVPDGLVNIVQGGGKTGSAICQTRDVKKISFTGSVSTGRIIAQMSSSDFVKPVTLELGGKSSCIIFDDVDIDTAVSGAMMANFFSQGSVCTNASKILIQKKILEDFTKTLVEKTRKLKIGDPLEESTRVGACISKSHLERVKGYIQEALKEGAELVFGGQPATVPGLPEGYFLEPCILSGIKPEMKIYKDEVFGAVLLIIPFETEEEALKIANNTQFGLAAGVFTNNLRRAHMFANKLEAGTVYINTFNDVSPLVPFGGFDHPYRLTQLALPHLEKTHGNVINTSSIAAITKQMDTPMYAIYGGSKAALDAWVKYDSARLGKLGVRINNINPGPFYTNIMFRGMPEGTPDDVKKAIGEKIEDAIAGSGPLKRWGKLEELVPAYLLLADNNASGFTLGACWVIDGGVAYCGSEPDFKF